MNTTPPEAPTQAELAALTHVLRLVLSHSDELYDPSSQIARQVEILRAYSDRQKRLYGRTAVLRLVPTHDEGAAHD